MSYSINVDRKWQKKWEETGLYKFDPNGKGDSYIAQRCSPILLELTCTLVTGTIMR